MVAGALISTPWLKQCLSIDLEMRLGRGLLEGGERLLKVFELPPVATLEGRSLRI